MRVESTIKPSNDFEIEVKDKLCEITFFDDIQKITKKIVEDEESKEETLYTYNKYTLEVVYRENLANDLKENTKIWLDFAKNKDYESKAAEVRTLRDKLLSESDKEMLIDRLDLTLPSNITATNILSVVKNFFNGISNIMSSDMAKYRQELRDIPNQDGFPYNVKFPEKPNK